MAASNLPDLVMRPEELGPAFNTRPCAALALFTNEAGFARAGQVGSHQQPEAKRTAADSHLEHKCYQCTAISQAKAAELRTKTAAVAVCLLMCSWLLCAHSIRLWWPRSERTCTPLRSTRTGTSRNWWWHLRMPMILRTTSSPWRL